MSVSKRDYLCVCNVAFIHIKLSVCTPELSAEFFMQLWVVGSTLRPPWLYSRRWGYFFSNHQFINFLTFLHIFFYVLLSLFVLYLLISSTHIIEMHAHFLHLYTLEICWQPPGTALLITSLCAEPCCPGRCRGLVSWPGHVIVVPAVSQ